MSKLDKKYIYNALLSIVQEHGQGLPILAMVEEGQKICHELVADGLCKIVTIKFNHIPDDVKLCLTKGYCVEDEMKIEENGHDPLTFVRYYLGQEELFGSLFPNKDHRKEFEANEAAIGRYNIWLAANKEKLEELKNLKPME